VETLLVSCSLVKYHENTSKHIIFSLNSFLKHANQHHTIIMMPTAVWWSQHHYSCVTDNLTYPTVTKCPTLSLYTTHSVPQITILPGFSLNCVSLGWCVNGIWGWHYKLRFINDENQYFIKEKRVQEIRRKWKNQWNRSWNWNVPKMEKEAVNRFKEKSKE